MQLGEYLDRIVPGMYLRAYIEPQANVPELRTPVEAVFFIEDKATPTDYGLDLHVMLVGARSSPGQGPRSYVRDSGRRETASLSAPMFGSDLHQ